MISVVWYCLVPWDENAGANEVSVSEQDIFEN